MAGLIAVAIGPILTMVLDRAFAPMGLIFVLLPLVFIGLVLTRNQWLLLVVVVISVVLLAGALRSPIVEFRLAHPAATGYFVVALLQLLGSAIATVAGLGTFVQRVSRRQPRSPGRA